MVMPRQRLAPGGLTWEGAMAAAAEILGVAKAEEAKSGSMLGKALGITAQTSAPVLQARAATAQAFIAFARELTMRERATNK